MGPKCTWCSRRFVPRTVGSENHYRLISAGVAICWSCSDLYDEAEIKLHFGPLKAKIDATMSSLFTDSGHRLPFRIENWHRTRWGKASARATDPYGKLWALKGDADSVTLKAIGA